MRGGDLQGTRTGGLQFMDCLRGQRCGTQEFFRVRTENSAGFGQGQAAAGAGEQGRSERFFQGLDTGADRGLAYAQSFRRAMKAAERGHCEEGLYLVDFHGLPGS